LPTTTPDGQRDFQQELLEIASDPMIKNLAMRRARDPELAKDAIRSTYYAIARVADPAAIADPRAYFCRALIREIYRLLGQLGASLVDNFTTVADTRSSPSAPAPRQVDETVGSNLLVQDCLRTFGVRRQELATNVPNRSLQPARYRAVIVATAEWILYASLTDSISDADCNAVFCSAYPEWFAEPGYAENTHHQRLRRARVDVRALLKTIVNRYDLYA
jgi:hypothetical protein